MKIAFRPLFGRFVQTYIISVTLKYVLELDYFLDWKIYKSNTF